MGSKAAAEKLLPFGAGFEAVGTVVALASDVQSALLICFSRSSVCSPDGTPIRIPILGAFDNDYDYGDGFSQVFG